ncbi:MAG: hypothetical protein ABSF15_10610 [Candidatus Sulfotelmatobacter sp.]|jgi:hypothetical protein
MLNLLRRVSQRGRSLLRVEGFAFDRPLVLLQSDDWGRVGVRDGEAWEQLRRSGIDLGQRNYDFYSLETATDVEAIVSLLNRHRDSNGRPACLGMNFLLANVDFAKVLADNFRQVHLRSLTRGLPDGWQRPGLFESYREGIAAGVLSPALHGTTHFCRTAVERALNDPGERGILLRTLWQVGVPYIHWRMPWIGFEYSDHATNGREAFLSSGIQHALIGNAVDTFTRFFEQPPRSACAPGYRATKSTHRAWVKHGVKVAQNGPGSAMPPHFEAGGDDDGGQPLLHLYRTIDFEPFARRDFSLDTCLTVAEENFSRGVPAIVSVHSINFHSTLKDFRGRTVDLLDEFLTALESRHSDLLYVRDEDLYDLVEKGMFESMQSKVTVQVTKRFFRAGAIEAARASTGAGR